MTRKTLIAPALLVVAMASTSAGCALATAPDRDLIEPGERGVLGGYRGGTVFGWAEGNDEVPALVRLSVAGEDLVITADRPRPDLVVKGIDPDGQAGFEADVGALPEGTEIRAFLVGSDLELTNSPFIVPPADGG